jgi:hypothetical protein
MRNELALELEPGKLVQADDGYRFLGNIFFHQKVVGGT